MVNLQFFRVKVAIFASLIFIYSCGSDVPPGKIEGPPKSSQYIYELAKSLDEHQILD